MQKFQDIFPEKKSNTMDTQPACLTNGTFDPSQGVFVAQDHRPVMLRDVNLHFLSPFLRALLVIDGTVTKFLEAWAMEAIVITRLNQVTYDLDEDHRWLETCAGDRIIKRQVMLVGRDTGRLYTFAESFIVSDRLSAPMQEGLDQDPGGLGKILLDSEMETRRQGLWYGQEQFENLPEPVAALWDGDFLTRTYRVIAGAKPLMLITERFPIPAGHIAAVS